MSYHGSIDPIFSVFVMLSKNAKSADHFIKIKFLSYTADRHDKTVLKRGESH